MNPVASRCINASRSSQMLLSFNAIMTARCVSPFASQTGTVSASVHIRAKDSESESDCDGSRPRAAGGSSIREQHLDHGGGGQQQQQW